MVGGGRDGVEDRFVSKIQNSNLHSNSSSPKAIVLEPELQQTVPPGRPVWHCAHGPHNQDTEPLQQWGKKRESDQSWDESRGVGCGHQSDDRRQMRAPEGWVGWRLGCRGLVVSLALGFLFQFLLHIYQLNSMWELNKMKGLKLEELWLRGNPLCDRFPDQSTYLRFVWDHPVTLLGDLYPWGPKLLLTVPLCQRWQPWSSGRIIGSAFSFLCSFSSVQFSSVTQLCPTLCNPMDCSTPGLPVHHQLPEFTQTHVHWVADAIEPLSSPSDASSSVIPFSSRLQSFPASGSFQMSQLFASGDQSIGVSVSASVLPVNIQDSSPLGWTGWISLQSKGLSRVFSNITVQKHQFFGAQLSL